MDVPSYIFYIRVSPFVAINCYQHPQLYAHILWQVFRKQVIQHIKILNCIKLYTQYASINYTKDRTKETCADVNIVLNF